MENYKVEYGTDYTITYSVEGDVDGVQINLISIATEQGTGFFEMFDKEDIADMKFHCEEDYSNRVFKHYMATGETL